MLMNHVTCQGITPPKLANYPPIPPSREISALPTKLIESDTGLVSPKQYSGLPDRLFNTT